MLNMTALLGAVPHGLTLEQDEVGLELYFAMARGTETQPAMEMTKWFDTNYHYIVPEFDADTRFRIASPQLFKEVAESGRWYYTESGADRATDILILGKERRRFQSPGSVAATVAGLSGHSGAACSLGVEWVQIDEPLLALDLEEDGCAVWTRRMLSSTESKLTKLLLTTYFEAVHNHATRLESAAGGWPAYRFMPQPTSSKFSRQLPCRESALPRRRRDGRNLMA